jgi:glycopeptide antibiotics resistance protein
LLNGKSPGQRTKDSQLLIFLSLSSIWNFPMFLVDAQKMCFGKNVLNLKLPFGRVLPFLGEISYISPKTFLLFTFTLLYLKS